MNFNRRPDWAAVSFSMKRIVTVILSIFVLFSSFSVSVFAEALSNSALPSSGVDYLFARFSEASFSVDGKASVGEYPTVHQFDPKTGNLISTVQGFDFAFCGIQLAVSYNRDFVYVALSDSSASPFSATGQPSLGACYRILVSVGFCDLYPQGLSECFNEYCFSKNDLNCTSVFGHRISYESGKRTFRGQIYTLHPEMEVPCEIQGKIWDAKCYQSEAVLLRNADGSSFFECRIPIADIATSSSGRVPPSQSDEKDAFCGSFRLETDLLVDGKHQAFRIGLPSDSIVSSQNISWKEYIAQNTAFITDQIPEVISLPLFFAGEPTVNQNPAPPSLENDIPQTSTQEIAVPSVTESEQGTGPNSSLHDPFPGLPQMGETVPDETVILGETDSDGEKDFAASSVLLFLAGVLLVLSVIGTSLIYQKMERDEKNGRKKKKTKNKS